MFISGRYYNIVGRLRNGCCACVSYGFQNNIKFFRSERNCIKYYNNFCNASSVLLIKNGNNFYRALIFKNYLLYDIPDVPWGVVED